MIIFLALVSFQVAVTTFAIYILTGHQLTASKAFVALSLFNVLRFPLVLLPDVVVALIQASFMGVFTCGNNANISNPP